MQGLNLCKEHFVTKKLASVTAALFLALDHLFVASVLRVWAKKCN